MLVPVDVEIDQQGDTDNINRYQERIDDSWRRLVKHSDYCSQPKPLEQALSDLIGAEIVPAKFALSNRKTVLDADLPLQTVDEVRRILVAYDLTPPEVELVCKYSPGTQFVKWA